MPRALRFLTPFGVLIMSGCGSATQPSSPASTQSAPLPSASASPSAPSATPAPGSLLPASCRSLPVAIGTPAGCRQEPSDFLRAVTDAVSAAQNALVTDPDTKEVYPLVRNNVIASPNAYLKMIVDSLDKQGLCAVYDGEELNVRNTTAFNEHFDIITGTGGSWTKYMSTCSPALPLPPIVTPPIQDAECKLAPSKDTYCDRPESLYGGDVFGALDEVIAQDRLLATPLIFDFSQRQPGIADGWKVKDVPLYFSELRKKLRVKGYCSIQNGDDELMVKKGTNRFSEHWDLLTAEGHSLRLLGAVCHDAAF
jgi:hypothetical protein